MKSYMLNMILICSITLMTCITMYLFLTLNKCISHTNEAYEDTPRDTPLPPRQHILERLKQAPASEPVKIKIEVARYADKPPSYLKIGDGDEIAVFTLTTYPNATEFMLQPTIPGLFRIAVLLGDNKRKFLTIRNKEEAEPYFGLIPNNYDSAATEFQLLGGRRDGDPLTFNVRDKPSSYGSLSETVRLVGSMLFAPSTDGEIVLFTNDARRGMFVPTEFRSRRIYGNWGAVHLTITNDQEIENAIGNPQETTINLTPMDGTPNLFTLTDLNTGGTIDLLVGTTYRFILQPDPAFKLSLNINSKVKLTVYTEVQPNSFQEVNFNLMITEKVDDAYVVLFKPNRTLSTIQRLNVQVL